MATADSTFLLTLHRAARRVAHAAFRPWVFRELGRHLRFDSGLWLRIAMTDDGPQMHDHHLERQRPDRVTSYLARELWRDDPMLHAIWAEPKRAVAMSADSVTSDRLREFLEQHENRHVVASFDVDPVTRVFAGIALFRRRPDDSFDEHDRRFIESVGPHVADTWTHNWLHHVCEERADDTQSGFALAVVTAGHTLTASDDHFAAMMNREWPEWRGPYLPAALREHLQRGTHPVWSGKSVAVHFRGLSGGLSLLRIRRCHTLDHLSPRKRAVAQLFAGGASQSHVAERLRLSPSTVNNYLVDIYRQLNVGCKAELAVLIAQLLP